MHDVAKEKKLLIDLRIEVPRMVELDKLLCEKDRHRKVNNHAVGGALLGVSLRGYKT